MDKDKQNINDNIKHINPKITLKGAKFYTN